MRFEKPIPLSEIASLIGATLIGNTSAEATGINEIHKVENGDLVFVDHPKYYDKCLNSDASCIIINNKEVEIPAGKAILFCEDPFQAYVKIITNFKPIQHSNTAVSKDLQLGKDTIIMPNVFIGNNVRIGDNCIIYPGVSIMSDTIIGNNVIIQANTVIGSDAFYYNTKKNRADWYTKMPSCGRVILEDKVEIGAGCTIDRGVSGDTITGRCTKIDNMVHIGHDTQTGANCLFAAGVAIAGGVKIKSGVTLWGQVGVNKTITIEDNVTVMGHSEVVGSLEEGKTYLGFPAEEASIKRREFVWIRRIPELWKKVMDSER